ETALGAGEEDRVHQQIALDFRAAADAADMGNRSGYEAAIDRLALTQKGASESRQANTRRIVQMALRLDSIMEDLMQFAGDSADPALGKLQSSLESWATAAAEPVEAIPLIGNALSAVRALEGHFAALEESEKALAIRLEAIAQLEYIDDAYESARRWKDVEDHAAAELANAGKLDVRED
ncbi:MAG: hypothetical protein AAFQ13_08025, partial [Pseudomonadota bacterium]